MTDPYYTRCIKKVYSLKNSANAERVRCFNNSEYSLNSKDWFEGFFFQSFKSLKNFLM